MRKENKAPRVHCHTSVSCPPLFLDGIACQVVPSCDFVLATSSSRAQGKAHQTRLQLLQRDTGLRLFHLPLFVTRSYFGVGSLHLGGNRRQVLLPWRMCKIPQTSCLRILTTKLTKVCSFVCVSVSVIISIFSVCRSAVCNWFRRGCLHDVLAERCTAFLTNFMNESSIFQYVDMMVRTDSSSARYLVFH
jgi:hypothetical protein